MFSWKKKPKKSPTPQAPIEPTINDQPMYPNFSPKYAAEAKEYWDALVPETGPAPTLQGELFRAVEKLWYEGQDNGNINWDTDFEYFIDLLSEHLLAPGELKIVDYSMADQSLRVLRRCGRIAYTLKPKWNRHDDYEAAAEKYPGIFLTDTGAGLLEAGYVHNDAYQHLRDCCVLFAKAHPEPIPYRAPEGFHR